MANVRVLGPTKEYLVMSGGALDAEFEGWWQAFPRKVGKLAARKAYAKARGQATSGELLGGVERYVRHKPAYADFCHPASWLNAGRWMDEYDAPSAALGASASYDAAQDDYHAMRQQAIRRQRGQSA